MLYFKSWMARSCGINRFDAAAKFRIVKVWEIMWFFPSFILVHTVALVNRE